VAQVAERIHASAWTITGGCLKGIFSKRLVEVFMHTAIVIDETGTQSAIQDTAQLLSDVNTFADIIVVSTKARPESFSLGIWVSAETLVEAMSQAANMAASKRVLVVSSSLTFNLTDLSRLTAEIENCRILDHIIVAPSANGAPLEVPEIASESIIQSLSRYDMWPLLCVATSRYALAAISPKSAETVTELITQALIRAAAEGDTIRLSNRISPLAQGASLAAISTLSAAAKARCLKAAVDSMNVEELFPQHNWMTYSKESAAASYHSLAAMFLSFSDPASAAECLACSEQLEESPRYFALQGLIQQAQGETLGAVANLVSSLQCYEARKSNDGTHYLSFAPGNLEILKTRLAEGLDALNKRDNQRALESFSEAVFNFDSFYAEHGVAPASRTRN
jgi:hypothetical protein